MKNIQSQSTSNPTSIAQVAAEAALNGDQGCIAPMLAEFKKRHAHVVARLNRINGVKCLPAQGAFYAFADFRAPSRSWMANDVAVAETCDTVGRAMVPARRWRRRLPAM